MLLKRANELVRGDDTALYGRVRNIPRPSTVIGDATFLEFGAFSLDFDNSELVEVRS